MQLNTLMKMTFIFNFIIKPEFLEFLSGMAEEQNVGF